MLIRCPRCGFSQPQDRYCAKCGVDMQSYRPKQQSFAQKIFANPFFHITIFGSLLIYATLFLVQKKSNLLNSDKARTFATQAYQSSQEDTSLEEESRASEPNEIEASEVVSQATVAAGAAGLAAEGGNATNSNSESTSPNSNTVTGPSEAKALAATPPLTLRIYFTETKLPFLQRIIEEARNFGQYDDNADVPFGVIQSMESRINSSNTFIDIIEKVELPVEAAKNNLIKVFRGKYEGSENEIGLYTHVQVLEIDNNMVKGEVDFFRTWMDKGNPDKTSNENRKMFDLAQRQGLFLANILPRTGLSDREGLFNLSIFKIMKSTPFRSQQTESVIYFQFLRPASQ